MAEKFSLTAQLRLQAPTNTTQVVDQIRRNLRGVNVDVSARGSAKTAKEINKINKELRGATGQAQSFATQLGIATKRAAGLAIATRVVSALTSRIKNAVDEAIAFERELIKISQVTGKTLTQLKGLSQEISRLSQTLGVSSASLITVSRQLSQAGFAAGELRVALSALAKTELAPTFDDITRTTEGAIALFNQFGKGAAALEGQLGAINAVAGKFAVESGDLIGVVRRVGGVFSAAGGSLEELLALFTSVRATTRESAESIATGLRTILTRIQRPRTIKFLKDLGVELTDAEGRFIGPIRAVEQLNKAFANLPTGSLEFLRISEEIAGFRQIGKVIPLIQQFTVAQEALKVAQAGQGSLADDAAKAQQGLGVQIEKVRQEYLALIREFTEGSAFKTVVSLALSFASALAQVLSNLKDILPLLGAVAAVKIFQGGGIGGLLGGLKGITKRNQGGPIGFARGGVVPGSGNRDTVPAMLTPGEFVIRKSSVGKIGAGTLAQMNENKFAKGGIVTKPDEIGMFVLNPSKGKDVDKTIKSGSTVDITNPAALSALGQGVGKQGTSQQLVNSQLFLNSTQAVQKEILGDNFKGLANTGKIGQSSFNKGDGKARGDRLKAAMDDQGVKDRLNTLQTSGKGGAGGLSSQTSAPAVNATSVPLSGAISTFFTAKRDVKKSSAISQSVSNATKQGMEDAIATSVTEASAVLQGIDPIDANEEKVFQRSLSNLFSKGGGAIESIEGYIFEGLIAGLTGASIAGKSANFDFNIFAKIQKERLANLFGDSQIDKLVKADAKRTYSASLLGTGKGSIGSKIGNDINDGDFRGVMFAAKGGAARGTDTVPAMLTPGEFVINKKAASNIGSANLNKMNKQGVTGFNKGGAVGHIQKFRFGGEAAEANIASSFSREGTELVGSLTDVKSIFKEFVSNIDGLPDSVQKAMDEMEIRSIGKDDKFKSGDMVRSGDQIRGVSQGGKIGVNLGKASKHTVKHEASHEIDRALGGGKKMASRQEGTFQNKIAEELRKSMIAEGDASAYRADQAELFADALAKAPPEVQAILVSTTDAAEGAKKLAAHFEAAGGPIEGLADISADELGGTQDPAKRKAKQDAAIRSEAQQSIKTSQGRIQDLTTQTAAEEDKISRAGSNIEKEKVKQKEAQFKRDELQRKQTSGFAAVDKLEGVRGETSSRIVKLEQKKAELDRRGGRGTVGDPDRSGVSLSTKDVEKELASLRSKYESQSKAINSATQNVTQYDKAIQEQNSVIQNSEKAVKGLNVSRDKYQANIDKASAEIGKEQSNIRKQSGTIQKLRDESGRPSAKSEREAGRSLRERVKPTTEPIVRRKTRSTEEKVTRKDPNRGATSGDVNNLAKLGALTVLPGLIDQFTSSVDENGNQVRSVFGEVASKAATFGFILTALGVELNASSLKKFFGTGPDSLGGQLTKGSANLKEKIKGFTESFKSKFTGGPSIGERFTGLTQRARSGLGRARAGIGDRASRLKRGAISRGRLVRSTAKQGVGALLKLGGRGVLGALGGGAGAAGGAAGAAVGGLGALGSAVAAAAGPIAALAGVVSLVSTGLNALFDAEGKYRDAIEEGNAAKAKENAVLKEVPGLIQAFGTGASEMFLNFMSIFGGPSLESIKALAGAAALASKADKDKAKAADVAKEALQDFGTGAKTAGQALSAGFTALGSQRDAIKAAREAADVNELNKSTGIGAGVRDTLSFVSFGFVESSASKNRGIDQQNKQLKADADKRQEELFQSSQGLLQGVISQAGGVQNFDSLDAFLASVDDGSEEFANVTATIGSLNADQQKKLRKIFEEEAKLRRDNIAAAQALNLGLSSVNGRADAVSSSLDRLAAQQNGTATVFSNSASVLKDAISSSAAFVSPSEVQKSKDVLANTLRGFGADEGQVSKAVGTVDVLNKAQSGFEAAFDASKAELSADGKSFTGDTVLESISRNLGAQLDASGADPAVIAQLQDSFKALSEDEREALATATDTGNFEKVRELLFAPLQQSAQEAIDVMMKRNKLEQDLSNFILKRIDAERKLADAQAKSIDIQLEAGKIIEAAGGKRLTTPEQTRARVAQFNPLAGIAGVGGLRTGSADDIRRVGRGITGSAAQQAGRAAAGDLESKDDRRQDLQKAQDGLIQFTRQRIQLLQQELDIVKQKNALERSAIDALLSGDAEGFFEQQGAAAAASAIRSGNTALLQSLDQSDISKGLASLEGQLSSAELFAAARTAGLSQRQAQVFSGTTAEEQSISGQIQDTARALAEQGQNAARLQELAVNTAEIYVQKAELKLEGVTVPDAGGVGGANAAAATAVAEGVTKSATEVTTAATQVAAATEQLTQQVATMQQGSNEVTHSHSIQPFQVQITGGDGLSSETIQVVIEDVFTNKIIPRITHQGGGKHKLTEGVS